MRTLIVIGLAAAVTTGPATAQMRRPARVLPNGSVVQSSFLPSYAAPSRPATARDAARAPSSGGTLPTGAPDGTPTLPNPYRVQAQTYAAPSAATAAATSTDATVTPTDQGAINATTPKPKVKDDGWQTLRTQTPRTSEAPAASPPPQ